MFGSQGLLAMTTFKTQTDLLSSLLAALALCVPLSACDPSSGDGVSDRGAGAGDDDDGICDAADDVGEACESVHGEGAPACAPFDDVDEACEGDEEDEEEDSRARPRRGPPRPPHVKWRCCQRRPCVPKRA